MISIDVFMICCLVISRVFFGWSLVFFCWWLYSVKTVLQDVFWFDLFSRARHTLYKNGQSM